MLNSSVKRHQGCTETPTLLLRLGPLQWGEAQRRPWRGLSVRLPGQPAQLRSAWWSEVQSPRCNQGHLLSQVPPPLPGHSAPAGMPVSVLPRKQGSLTTAVLLRHLGFISERATPWASAFPKNWKLIAFPPVGLRRLSTAFPLRRLGNNKISDNDSIITRSPRYLRMFDIGRKKSLLQSEST